MKDLTKCGDRYVTSHCCPRQGRSDSNRAEHISGLPAYDSSRSVALPPLDPAALESVNARTAGSFLVANGKTQAAFILTRRFIGLLDNAVDFVRAGRTATVDRLAAYEIGDTPSTCRRLLFIAGGHAKSAIRTQPDPGHHKLSHILGTSVGDFAAT